MDDFTQDQVTDMIYSMFDVSEIIKEQYSMVFRISDTDYTSKFAELARILEGSQYTCRLQEDQGIFITIQKFAVKKPGRIMSSSWTPRILFVVVCIFVGVDGYYRTLHTNSLAYVGEPIPMAIIYTLSLLGILGIHEAGHLVAARIHRLKTTWPFFIPGVPIVGIPTFGAFIKSPGLTINRRILFDVAIAGPVAGAVVAVIVALAGSWSAPVIDERTAEAMLRAGTLSEFQMGEPLLIHGALALFDKNGPGIVVFTPILWASWLGFLITFLNLLPAWQLDGGHMARTILNAQIHRYVTFGSMAVLVMLNFWVMALLILALSMMSPSPGTMDRVSKLTPNRKKAYVGVLILAALCAPIPTALLP